MKYDATGNEIWASTYSGPGPLLFATDQARAIAIDPDGDVIVTGISNAANGIEDYATVKYRGTDGAQLWVSRYTGAGANDIAVDVAVDGSGHVYVTGISYQGGEKIATVKYRGSDGAFQWSAIDDPGVHDRVAGIVLGPGNVLYLAGTSDPDFDESNSNDNTFALRRQTATGARDWISYYGTNGLNEYDSGADLALDQSGNLYITGTTSSFGASRAILLLRLNAATGAELEVSTCNTPSGGSFDSGRRMGIAPDNDVLVTGSTVTELPNGGFTGDIVTLRYPGAGEAVAVGPADAPGPGAAHLTRNTPNPFFPSTTIHFEMEMPAHARLEVFDVRGRTVATLVDGALPAGPHAIAFDGGAFPAGRYYYRLTAPGLVETRSMTLVR